MSPLVSILVTVYNREKYLAATLESILASGFLDFELIVVDDQSRDDSIRIAQEYAATDSRVRVIRNERNLGDYGNRMKAAGLARGRFIKYVDSDDLIYPHSLGVMVDAVQRRDDIGLALAHSMPEDEEPYPWVLSGNEAYRKQYLGRGCLSCGPTGAIIRRSAFENCGGFDAKWKVLSDIDLWLRMAARYSVALLPPGLVWWRRHEGQEFRSREAERTYREMGFQLNQERLQDPKCPLSLNERSVALRRMNHRHARGIASLALKHLRWRDAWSAYRSSGLSLGMVLSSVLASVPSSGKMRG
jgi:glycosyltransferase involved in cell wall biosynthesis